MDVQAFQHEVVKVIKSYGRPPTMGGHLEKLGEEIGELANAVYLCGATVCPDVETNIRKLERHVAEECCDVINVCVSLIDMVGYNAEPLLIEKINILKERIANGRRDRKFGKCVD